MAIAFDTAIESTRVTTGTTNTFSHTCTGSDRILFVEASLVNPSSSTVTGVTYNGVAMTKVANVATQSNIDTSLWYLIAPATGANDVVITASTTIGSYMEGCASSYAGASQTGVPDASASSTGSSNSFSESVTTIADNCWTVAGVFSNAAPSVSTGSTSRAEAISGSVRDLIADSNGAITPAGSTTMNFTAGATDSYGVIMASFAPAVAASTSIKSINGLAIASVKSRNGLAIASIKSINGLSNVS